MQGLPHWMGIFINYAIMLAVTLILVIASSMGDPTTYGFTRPRIPGAYGPSITWGVVLGVIASVVNLMAGAGRIGPLAGLSFLQIVLLVWLLASVAEEVLVRGYVQSYMTPLVGRGFTVFRLRLSLPVTISALFFAAIEAAYGSLVMLWTSSPRPFVIAPNVHAPPALTTTRSASIKARMASSSRSASRRPPCTSRDRDRSSRSPPTPSPPSARGSWTGSP